MFRYSGINGQTQLVESSELHRMLGGDGVSARQRQHLAFQFKATFLYSAAGEFCAKLIEPVCLEEIVRIHSDDQTASSVQEPLGS